MIRSFSFLAIVAVLFLSGCDTPAVVRSVAPIIEPPLESLGSAPGLDSDVSEIENYVTGNSRAIELAGYVNTYRGEQGLGLASWSNRLYEIALKRATQLSMDDTCWTEHAGCDRTQVLNQAVTDLGYTWEGSLLESAYISVGRSLDLEHCSQVWQQHRAHRANLGFKDVDKIAVAIVGVGDVRVYVMLLGKA